MHLFDDPEITVAYECGRVRGFQDAEVQLHVLTLCQAPHREDADGFGSTQRLRRSAELTADFVELFRKIGLVLSEQLIEPVAAGTCDGAAGFLDDDPVDHDPLVRGDRDSLGLDKKLATTRKRD